MSLGGGKSTAVNEAVAGAVTLGVTFVVAAGNEAQNACNVSNPWINDRDSGSRDFRISGNSIDPQSRSFIQRNKAFLLITRLPQLLLLQPLQLEPQPLMTSPLAK
jgi:subtilisin family serine protease